MWFLGKCASSNMHTRTHLHMRCILKFLFGGIQATTQTYRTCRSYTHIHNEYAWRSAFFWRTNTNILRGETSALCAFAHSFLIIVVGWIFVLRIMPKGGCGRVVQYKTSVCVSPSLCVCASHDVLACGMRECAEMKFELRSRRFWVVSRECECVSVCSVCVCECMYVCGWSYDPPTYGQTINTAQCTTAAHMQMAFAHFTHHLYSQIYI